MRMKFAMLENSRAVALHYRLDVREGSNVDGV